MSEVNAKNIEDMIRIFINKGFEDEVLSEMFTKSITNVDNHVARVSGFWKHRLLKEGEYKQENFHHSHEGLRVNKEQTLKEGEEGSYVLNNGITVKKPLSRQHFESWMKCFKESAEQTFKNQETVNMIVSEAKQIAEEMHDIER